MIDQTSPIDTEIPLIGWGDYSTLKDQIASRTFGHMVRLATPVVKEYHSDLYIDAMNLPALIEQNMNAMETGTSFFYAVRKSGTFFGEMALAADSQNHGDSTFRLYWIHLSMDARKAWIIEIEDRTGGGADLIAGRY